MALALAGDEPNLSAELRNKYLEIITSVNAANEVLKWVCIIDPDLGTGYIGDEALPVLDKMADDLRLGVKFVSSPVLRVIAGMMHTESVNTTQPWIAYSDDGWDRETVIGTKPLTLTYNTARLRAARDIACNELVDRLDIPFCDECGSEYIEIQESERKTTKDVLWVCRSCDQVGSPADSCRVPLLDRGITRINFAKHVDCVMDARGLSERRQTEVRQLLQGGPSVLTLVKIANLFDLPFGQLLDVHRLPVLVRPSE